MVRSQAMNFELLALGKPPSCENGRCSEKKPTMDEWNGWYREMEKYSFYKNGKKNWTIW